MNKDKTPELLFGKENYILLIAGAVILIIGFMLMAGGGSESLDHFDESEIFSPRRITVAPLTIMVGFLVVFYAILRKPRQQENGKEE